MADNIELNAGTGGAVVATDEVTGSVHYQLIKPAYGGLGVATLVSGSTPLPIQGTTDFPLTVVGSVSIIGTVPISGATTGTVFITSTAPVAGSVSIIGGTVGVNVTGGALTGTSPVSGSVSIIGGTVTTQVTAGSVNATILGGSVRVGGTVQVTSTVPIVGSVSTSVTVGTIPAITSTVNVLASPSDAQQQWGGGSVDVIQVGLITPAGTVAANAGLPISGTLAAITGTVSIVGSVSTTVTTGTTPVFGTVTQPVYITGSVSVPGTVTVVGSVTSQVSVGTVIVGGGTLAAITGTVPVFGSVSIIGGTVGVNVTGGALTGTSPVAGSVSIIQGSVNVGVLTGGSINVGGSVTTQTTAGSVNVSVLGTLPDKNQNQIYSVVAGTTSRILGSVGGTGDYLSHLTIVVASTDANQVILADHTQGTFTVFPSVPGPGKTTYTVAVDAYSRFGPWRLTTGGGVTVLATGRFTN